MAITAVALQAMQTRCKNSLPIASKLATTKADN